MTSVLTTSTSLDPASVHREVLPNGLTVLVRRDTSAPVVAIVTHVRAGYFDETDDVVGIAHVLEHMFFKGTARRGVGEIAKQTKAVGGYLNASTIYDHTVYYTVLPSSGFEAGLDIQADAYAGSVIDADELRKELEVIIQEAKRKTDNPSAVATETLFEVLHDRHRIRRWRIGREEGLRRLTRDDLLRFYRNFYRPSQTILSIVGDVDVAHAMRLVERHYGSLEDAEIARSPGADESSPAGFRWRELAGDIAQTQIVVGWRTPHLLHEDTVALDVAASVLGSGRASRLYRAVRERQLCSSVQAYNYTPTTLGVFVAHAEARPETAGGAARAMWDQVRRVAEEGVGAGEIERTRRLFESRWARRLESMDGQATHLAEWEALGGWPLGDQYLERVLAVDHEAVRRAAETHLAPDQASWVVYRPREAAPLAPDAEAARAMLDAGRPDALPALSSPAAVAPTVRGTPPLEREEGDVRVYRTRGGVPVLVRRRPGAAIAYMGVFGLGGATIEPVDLGGVTLFTARGAVKGTERRSASRIAEEAELLGGGIGASASSDGFGWSFSVPTANVPRALELLGDVVQHATFPDEAIETERGVAIADLASMRDDMYRYPLRLVTEAAWDGHPYAASVLGSDESLRRIGAADVRGWHRRAVLEGATVIGIAGDCDPDAAAALVDAAFGELRLGEARAVEAPAWPAEARVREDRREKAQTALAIAFPGPDRRDPRRFAARVLAGIASGLGGRFFDELRDRQSLAYTVAAYPSERALAGMFVSYIATGPEKEEVARRGLLAEFAKLRESVVTDEELERAKTYAIGTHAIRQQDGGAVLGDIIDAWQQGTGLRELGEWEESVRRVRAEDIRVLAREFFDESRRVEGVVRGVGRVD